MKRQKLEKGAHSSIHETSSGEKPASKRASDSESVQTDNPRKWDIMVFACMNKTHFSNWLQRKQHGVKLASGTKGEKSPDKYTPESVIRLSERLLRRAKMRIRQSSRSCSKSPVSDFDFDDLDLESNLQIVPFGQKNESRSCDSKNESQDKTLSSLADVYDTVDNCTVHSDEHVSLICTVESEDVQRNIQNSSADVCREVDTTDLLCDKEVSIILESGETGEKPVTSKVFDGGTRNTTNFQKEHFFDVRSNGPATGSEDVCVDSCGIGQSISVHGDKKVLEDSVEKLLDPPTDITKLYLNLDCQGNHAMALRVANGSEKIDEGQDKQVKEQISVSNDSLLREAEVTGGGSQIKDVAESGEQLTVLSTRDSATKGIMEVIQSTCEGSIASKNGHTSEVVENVLVDNDLSSSGMMVDEEVSEVSLMDAEKSTSNMNVSEKEVNQSMGKSDDKEEPVQETLSSNPPCQALPVTDTEKRTADASVSKHQPDLSKKRLVDGDLDKTPLAIQAADKSGEPSATITNNSPFVITSILGPDQVNQYLSTVDVGSSGVGTSQTTAMDPFTAPVTTHYHVLPPPPQNFLWPGIAPCGPFPTAEVMPVHSKIQHSNYGFPSWANHAPHVPFSVGCAQSAAASDDICPPGTEDDTPKLNSKPAGPNTREVHEKTDENQPHGSVMDQSVVTALMKFYSEISEVEEGVKNENKKAESDNETKAIGSIPKPQELEQVTGNKGHGVSDMEMESDFDGSHMDVSDVDISQIEQITENATNFDGPIQEECSRAELESTEMSVKQVTLVEDITAATTDSVSIVLGSTVDTMLLKKPTVCSTLSSTVDALQIESTAVSGDLTQDQTHLMRNPDSGVDAAQVESLDVPSPMSSAIDIFAVDSPIVETPTEAHPLSPIDPEFLENAEQTIFSSIGDLRNLLGQSSSFDRIAEEAITSTVSSLEEILRQAQSSYLELSSCPSDSGVSTGEEVSHPFKLSSSVPVPMSPVQDSTRQTYTSAPSCSVEETASKGSFVWQICLFLIQNTVEPPEQSLNMPTRYPGKVVILERC